MTRLTTEDIASISENLAHYDRELISKTGCSLRQIACEAMDIAERDIQDVLPEVCVGVIPVSFGEGILGEFSQTVADIVAHVGCRTFVTEATDVGGIAESMERNADVIMLADDDRFIALHLRSRRIMDNSSATGTGYVAGLKCMAGGLKGRKVLVMGCGPVGRSAVKTLLKLKTNVSIYDVNSKCYNVLFKVIDKINIHIVDHLDKALQEHDYIIDATPAEDVIHADHIDTGTVISAPGVPLGLGDAALTRIENRLLHDPLQIGVATMAMGAVVTHMEFQ